MTTKQLNRDENFPNQYGELNPVTSYQINRLKKILRDNEYIPQGYENFLSSYNGGVFNECLIKDSPLGVLVASNFLSISNKQEESLEKETAFFQEEIGGGYIPIATDPGGNYFLLGCDKSNFNKIYFWIHDQRKCNNNPTEISSSFENFVNALQLDE